VLCAFLIKAYEIIGLMRERVRVCDKWWVFALVLWLLLPWV